MAIRQMIFAMMGGAMLGLGACSNPDEPILMHAASENRGPDEFSIVPTRPLEMPRPGRGCIPPRHDHGCDCLPNRVLLPVPGHLHTIFVSTFFSYQSAECRLSEDGPVSGNHSCASCGPVNLPEAGPKVCEPLPGASVPVRYICPATYADRHCDRH